MEPPSSPSVSTPYRGAKTSVRMLAMRLVPADLPVLDAALESDSALGEALGVEVASGWNSFPAALERVRDAVAADPESVAWGTRLFVIEEDEGPVLVGWGGFKGAPAKRGEVELGYEIAPSHQGRGLATAAVTEMLTEAFAAVNVRSVIAHTLAEPGPSVRVLEKTGFAHDAELPGDEDGPLWRFRLKR
jgi:[ribosomal protein S5]-alanine N-acetyltransferase